MPIYEYKCPVCGVAVDSIESYPPPATIPCACGEDAEQKFPMPARTPEKWTGRGWGSAATKASGPRTPPPANAVNTQPIADGMSTAEWKRRRKKQKAEAIRSWAKDVT